MYIVVHGTMFLCQNCYSIPGTEQSIVMSRSLCLSVCLSVSIHPGIHNFLCDVLSLTTAWSSDVIAI